MAMASPRAILIVTFNIFRVLCKKYGIYIIIGMVIVIFQGYSGYYVLRLGADDNTLNKNNHGRALPMEEINIEKSQLGLESRVYQGSDRADADSHNKGPPDSMDSKELSKEWLGIELPCTLKSRESLSAIKRANTQHCKTTIANISCQIQSGSFYPQRLPSYCPSNGKVRGKPMGCFEDSRESRILRGFAGQLKRNTPSLCCDICYQRGYIHAGVQYGKECFCGNEDIPLQLKVPEHLCNMPCSGDGKLKCGDYLHINIYQTGLPKYVPVPAKSSSLVSGSNNGGVRIAFILTVNGRAIRQLKRLIKALYHKDHYFFIHVDSRQDYLYREVLKLEDKFINIEVSRFRLSTIWGGASLLKILLHCMKQVLNNTHWHWDFIINLSESDYPIKTNDELVKFLSNNRERNFLKSHGHDTNKFLQKQGLDRTFLECETHMWRIGERRLPMGIRVDGGSDWLCLNRQFVEYVINSQSQLVNGLKKVYSYTLLPAESFFHTVLRNCELCQTFTDNNLHITNWKRKLGCKCQYKHIVDWCGCSPNDFTTNDWHKLQASSSRNLFFARKFEAVISQAIINQVDAWLYTPYYSSTPGLDSYWENRYHHSDSHHGTNADTILTFYHSAARLATPGLDSYWENRYHHSDSHHGTSADTILTFYHSAARLSTRVIAQLASSSASTCDIYPRTILQAHSYHASDVLKGQLVRYEGSVDGETWFEIETWIFAHVKYTIPIHHNINHRLIGVEVGSDYDVKEQVLRNWGVTLSVMNDVTVVTRWCAGLTGDGPQGTEDTHTQMPLIVLSDSTNIPVAHEEIILEPGEQVVSHTFSVRKPLLPGTWTVRILIDNVVLAIHTFPIIPTQFVQAQQINLKQTRSLHKGPSLTYTDNDMSEVMAILGINKHNINSSVKDTLIQKSHLVGPHLSYWIDEIVTRFYTIQDSCYIPGPNVPKCIEYILESCDNTGWSSISPDAKCELSDIDDNTGRITDPYRVGDKEF